MKELTKGQTDFLRWVRDKKLTSLKSDIRRDLITEASFGMEPNRWGTLSGYQYPDGGYKQQIFNTLRSTYLNEYIKTRKCEKLKT